MQVRSVLAVRDAGPRSSVRGLAVLLAALFVTTPIATALAAQVAFPKDEPKVTMEVPDGWDVTYNAFGLQIVSPEKDLVILADLLPRKKAEADGWAIKAEGKLGAFGVSFDPAHAVRSSGATVPEPKKPVAASPPTTEGPKTAALADKPVPSPAASMPTTPAPEVTPAPSFAGQSGAGATTGTTGTSIASGRIDRAAPTFTFMNPPTKIEEPPPVPAPPAAAYFGAPSLDTPTKPVAPTAVRTDVNQGFTLDKMDRLSNDRPKIPFAAGRLPSATMNGQPVDVQIVNFSISKSQLFLMIQASGPTDNRAVAILLSVKPAG